MRVWDIALADLTPEQFVHPNARILALEMTHRDMDKAIAHLVNIG